MNKVILLFSLCCFFVGCNSNTKEDSKGQNNFVTADNSKDQNNIITNFIENVTTLETDTNKNPITAFKNLANQIAQKKIVLTKDNINVVLNETKNYSSCIIVVANHTIVKIKSTEDCKQSGSWKTCMPLVTGYIKRGKLDFKSGYMNNVIGTPDDQERIAYFFHNSKEKIEINTAETVDLDTGNWESPKNLFLIDDFYSSIIIRAEARYNNSDGLNEEERNWIKNTDTLQWWVLPIEGIAKKVNVKKNFIYTTKLCGDFGNFYATELDCDPNEISIACLGNPPKSWFKKAPKCIISKDEAIQLINTNLPAKFKSIKNKVIITESTAGWDGYVNWCCPKEDNPIHKTVDEMSIVEYRIPVIVSAQSKITIGDVKAHVFGGEGSMKPALKRDIDGDGILEIFWTGCQNYWTHNNKNFISNIGDCCGC